jgi:hypothetical protein
MLRLFATKQGWCGVASCYGKVDKTRISIYQEQESKKLYPVFTE